MFRQRWTSRGRSSLWARTKHLLEIGPRRACSWRVAIAVKRIWAGSISSPCALCVRTGPRQQDATWFQVMCTHPRHDEPRLRRDPQAPPAPMGPVVGEEVHPNSCNGCERRLPAPATRPPRTSRDADADDTGIQVHRGGTNVDSTTRTRPQDQYVGAPGEEGDDAQQEAQPQQGALSTPLPAGRGTAARSPVDVRRQIEGMTRTQL